MGDSPVTMQQIAREAGVSHSTVSRVLSGSSLIGEATRERVRGVAERLGYRPDPALRALVARRFHHPRDPALTHLGILRKRSAPRVVKVLETELAQAGAAAGYQMSRFTVRNYTSGSYLASQTRMIFQRGIRGVFVLMDPKGSREWPDPSVFRDAHLVGVGSRVREHPVHSVLPDRSTNLHLAMDWLEQQGCRRIGLAIEGSSLRRKGETLLAAFLARTYLTVAPPQRIPPLVGSQGTAVLGGLLQTWLREHRPDGLLVSEHHFLPLLEAADPDRDWHSRLVVVDPADPVAGYPHILNDWAELARSAILAMEQTMRGFGGAQVAAKRLTMVSGRLAVPARSEPNPAAGRGGDP